MKTETVVAAFLTFCMVTLMLIVFSLYTTANNFPPKEKQIVYTLPEKTNMPCMVYKVDGAFVIIINDEELSK